MNKTNSSFNQYPISPVDGRYRHKLTSLSLYLTDFALNKYRVFIELAYLKNLSQAKIIRKFSKIELASFNQLNESFNSEDYQRIREIEKIVNHDVKAVEEFVKEKLLKTSLKDIVSMVHFGITSDDVNNLAYGLMIQNSLNKIIIPKLVDLDNLIKARAKLYKDIPMLSRTHGQPAAPTTVGHELAVFSQRLHQEIVELKKNKIKGKLTGNTGNLNAHQFIYSKFNWLNFSSQFVRSLDLEPDLLTTQIEPYDSYIQTFDSLRRINNILLGFCIDMWIYISMGYFKQQVIGREVGSTALPHKVNPIYFEGAEGNFGIANALLEFYARKLSYSRLQRDLSDSTVRRSFGIALSYCFLGYESVIEAINRIEPNKIALSKDLNNHWEVLSEAIQNFLRVRGYADAYNQTKLFFRGRDVGENDVKKFIESLKLEKKDREKLLSLTPEKYIGYASELVDKL